LICAISNKPANLTSAVAPRFAHYDFVRVRSRLRIAPAMAAGVANNLRSMQESAGRALT
jgi:hypothetical protein